MHKRRVLVQTVMLLVVIVPGFAQSSKRGKSPKPEDAVRAADQEWLRLFAGKDVAKSVDYVLADGSVLAPNVPIATGHEAISRLFTGFFALPDLNISWLPAKVEVARSADVAYSTGAYRMTFKDASGKLIEERGKYVTIWKKDRAGKWKVAYDIFNSDQAAPAP